MILGNDDIWQRKVNITFGIKYVLSNENNAGTIFLFGDDLDMAANSFTL